MTCICPLIEAAASFCPTTPELAAGLGLIALGMSLGSPVPDLELVRACGEGVGDQEVLWREFIRRFDPWIVVYVRSYCRQWRFEAVDLDQLVDDLVQEVYLRLLADDRKALRRFRGRQTNEFYGYLKLVARTVVVNHFSKFRRDYDAGPKSGISEPEGGAAAEEVMRRYWEEVASRLRSVEKARNILVFVLNRFEDLSPRTIARLPGIGLSASGVETLVSRMMQRFSARRSGRSS